MNYYQGKFNYNRPAEVVLTEGHVEAMVTVNGELRGIIYDITEFRNIFYGRESQFKNDIYQIAPIDQKAIFSLVDSSHLINEDPMNDVYRFTPQLKPSPWKEAKDIWAVPAFIDDEHLIELSKAWNGWTKAGDPKGLGDNPFKLGSAIKLLNLIVVTGEDRSSYGTNKSSFTLNRFNLLVDMERTTEEDILALLGRHYSQDSREFHIGEKSLGHPDNPVPAGMEGYTYKSKAGLLIVGAEKFIYFPKSTLLGNDGAAIPVDAKSTVSGEKLLNQGFNPVVLSMRGNEKHPILEKNTALGKQKIRIDESGCLITRIAPYISNVPSGGWWIP